MSDNKSLFDKFEASAAIQKHLASSGLDPTHVVIDEILSATEGKIQGKTTILAGTNNYLGLTFNEDCIEAGRRSLLTQGTGTTGSRMANGSFDGHVALERELAEFYGTRHCMIFSTGYTANLGILSALLEPGDAVLLDADAHASLYDGCRMSGADVYRFKHNDVEALAKRLRRLGERAKRCLIITEGMYSILGDCAPLTEMVELKEKYGAYLFVDEAHSLGVFGETGRGVAEDLGLDDKIDFIVGTFSKSLGATGGYCVSNHEVLNLVRYASRPYIFTASPSPSVIATTREALRQLKNRPELREQLWNNAQHLYAGLKALNLHLGPDISPVVAVRMQDNEAALVGWKKLIEEGVYTNMIVPPASPDGSSFLRCSVSAAHTEAQIEKIIAAFRKISG